MAKFSRTREHGRSTSPPMPTREPRPTSLGVGGFLLFFAGLAALVATLAGIGSVVRGDWPLSELLTWMRPDSGHTWPLGVLVMALAPLSLVSGFRLMRDGPRRPALLASLGWLLVAGLVQLETGSINGVGFVVLPAPFMLWGTWIETQRMGFRAALAA